MLIWLCGSFGDRALPYEGLGLGCAAGRDVLALPFEGCLYFEFISVHQCYQWLKI